MRDQTNTLSALWIAAPNDDVADVYMSVKIAQTPRPKRKTITSRRKSGPSWARHGSHPRSDMQRAYAARCIRRAPKIASS